MSTPTPRRRLTDALAGEPVDRPPVWFMRQAGRSLPAYRKVREDHDFLEVCHDPELAREVTLQPVDRFGMDAAVVFSDILLPPRELGFEVRYASGVGPVVDNPIREPERVDELTREPPDELPQAEAIEAIRERRPDLGIVGFAGAPFTLASYLIEGGSPKRYEHVNRIRHEHPDAFAELLGRLADVVGQRLAACAEGGADAVQLFDTHAEELAARDYAGSPRTATQHALDHVDDDTATIAFARGSAHLLEPLQDLDVDALSLDWRVDLAEAAQWIEDKALQGNLDPGLLQAPPQPARERTRELLEEGEQAEGHVVNLGHGVTPNARLETIQAVVDTVQEAGP